MRSFKHLKTMDYETLYQDDMCWEAILGIRMDLGGASDWDELSRKIKDASIDDTGKIYSHFAIKEFIVY